MMTCGDKDSSSRSGVGDEEVHVEKGEAEWEDVEKEDSDGEDFFDAGEGAANDDWVSSCATSKSGQSDGDTEDDPVGPMTPGSTTKIVTSSTLVAEKTSRKMHAVSFTRAASASTDGGDLDDEEWVDPTSVPAMPLDETPPSKALFQRGTASAPVAPMMAKTISSSSISGEVASTGKKRTHQRYRHRPRYHSRRRRRAGSREWRRLPARRRVHRRMGMMASRGAYRR